MTKDKAIAELVRIWNSPHLDLSLKAGLGEAIDALKGEPDFWDEDDYWAMTNHEDSETLNGVDGDLISRQDAIDAWDKLSKRGRTEFDQVLMTLPSAEPKTGRWTWDDKGYFYCGRCGKKPDDQTRTTDYCPNCGAKMLGEDGEE